MNRLKRWSVLPLALIAMSAFASSAMANELPGMEQEGKPLPVGAIIELRETALFTIYSQKLGTIDCNIPSLEAKVIQNEAQLKAPYFRTGKGGTSIGESCARAGAELKIFGVELAELETKGPVSEKTHEAPAVGWLRFSVEMTPGGLVCTFFPATTMSWSFVPGTNSIKLNPSAMTVSPLACFGKENKVSGEYSVFSGGKPVILN